MAATAILLAAVLVLALVHTAGSQITPGYCQPFEGQPTFCVGVIEGDVWINATTNQSSMAAFLINSGAGLLKLLPSNCATPAILAACSSLFRPCGGDGYPLPICPHICADYVGNCTGSIPSAYLPDCQLPDAVIGGQHLYEPSRPDINGTGTEQCYDASSLSANLTLNCTYPFGLDYSLSPPGCSLLCPAPTLDNSFNQYVLNITFLVVIPIAITCQLFLFVPWVLRFRIEAPFYALFFLIASMLISFGYLFNFGYRNFTDTLCVNQFTIRTQYNSASCWFTGAFINAGVVASTTWITAILYHLLNGIKMNKWQIFGAGRPIPISPLLAYNLIGWGVPLLCVIVCSAWFGYSASNGLVCLPDALPANRWYMDIVFFFPIQIFFTLSIILCVMLFYTIYKLGSWRALRSQVRLFALCIYYIIVQGYSQGYLLYQKIVQNQLKDGIAAYVQCLQDSPSFPPPPGGCEVYIDPYPNFWALWFSQILGTTPGIIVLIIFVNPDLIYTWRNILTCHWRDARSGKTTSGSGGSGHSPQGSGSESGEKISAL